MRAGLGEFPGDQAPDGVVMGGPWGGQRAGPREGCAAGGIGAQGVRLEGRTLCGAQCG